MAPKKKSKPNKTYTPEITKRFLKIMAEAIASDQVKTRMEFAESIGEHQQNLSKMKQGTRAPTLEHIAIACKKYGYSPTWVMLGIGDKKMKGGQNSLDERILSLEKDMALIQKELKK